MTKLFSISDGFDYIYFFRHYEPLVALSPDSEEKLLVAGTNLKQEESDDETQDAKVKITNMHVWYFKREHYILFRLSYHLNSDRQSVTTQTSHGPVKEETTAGEPRIQGEGETGS